MKRPMKKAKKPIPLDEQRKRAKKRKGVTIQTKEPPRAKGKPITRARDMVKGERYRYERTPDCYYEVPKSVTWQELERRLDRKANDLHGRDMYLLFELARIEHPVLARRVNPRTNQGEYVIFEPDLALERLEAA